MKAGKRMMDHGNSVHTTPSTTVETKNTRWYHQVLLNGLPIFSMVIMILPGIIHHIHVVDIIKIGILTFILTSSTVFYIRWNKDHILYRKSSEAIIGISYLISLLFLVLFPRQDILLWMLGGLIVSMLIDNKLGLLLHFNFSFILSIYRSLRPEFLILFLILGALICFLSTSLCKKDTMIYASIIILSTHITLSFVINNFLFSTETGNNYLISFFSVFIVLVMATLIYHMVRKYIYKDHQSLETMNFNREAAVSGDTLVISEIEDDRSNMEEAPYAIDTRTSYELLLKEDNELLSRLKDFSLTIYQHGLQIGDLSSRAAKLIGADEMLAKAGGLYHEIGKINGPNYIEEGLKLAEEYKFPKKLIGILRQHNIKYDKPTSVEAAIVMLSDNVVSTIEYIEKSGDSKYPTNKIIDNIFQMRMDKGTFDDAGLSVKDFKELKAFYIEEFSDRN